MKSIRNLLTALAFVFAFGAAFALDAKNSASVQKFGEFQLGCMLANLNEPNCATVVTTLGRCTVTSGIQTTEAFDAEDIQGNCINALYKQP